MIALTRLLAHQLRSLVRRGLGWNGRQPQEFLHCRVSNGWLRIDAAMPEIGITYQLPVTTADASLSVPISALAACEGKTDDRITLAPNGKSSVLLAWQDGPIPRQHEAELPKPVKEPSVVAEPEAWTQNSAELLNAFKVAYTVTDRFPTRYALDCLLLRGNKGEIAATDGHQILLQNGFQFGWAEDLIVAATNAFACPVLASDQPVYVGRTNDWVFIRSGPWTIRLKIATSRRYPQIDTICPASNQPHSTLSLADEDRAYLLDTLPRLPGKNEESQPLTVNLNGSIAIQARENRNQPPAEVVLSRSSRSGEPICFKTDRRYLKQALDLGFSELAVYGPQRLIQCVAGHRKYLWAMLHDDSPAASPASATHSDATPASQSVGPPAVAPADKRATPPASVPSTSSPMKTPQPRPPEQTQHNDNPAETSPIAAAVALQQSLRTALADTHALVNSLKRQSKLMQTTLASLKQLQAVA